MRWLLFAGSAALVSTVQTPPKLTPADLKAPCVELITADELKTVGRKDVLTQVHHEHEGSSVCGWQTSETSGFIVTRQTAEWFKYEQTSGPKESFEARRQAYDAVVGTDPVPDVGLEARITRHKQLPTVLVRRAADVIMVMCPGCSPEQTIAIAKLAAKP
jgi:hypothetical protein